MNRVPNVVLSTTLFPYLEDQELARLVVSKRFQRLISRDSIWSNRWNAFPSHQKPSYDGPRSWKAYVGLGYSLPFRMAQAEKKGRGQSVFYNLAYDLLIAVMGGALLVNAVNPPWAREYNICMAPAVSTYREKQELALALKSKALEDYSLKYEINGEALNQLHLAAKECLLNRSGIFPWGYKFLVNFAVGVATCTNSFSDLVQSQSLKLRIMNMVVGVSSIWVGCSPEIEENGTLRGMSMSAGGWFLLKGILPQRAFTLVCGAVAGKTHALGIWTFSKAKQCFRSLKNFLFKRII